MVITGQDDIYTKQPWATHYDTFLVVGRYFGLDFSEAKKVWCSGVREAITVEVFPAVSQLVDQANMYWLWSYYGKDFNLKEFKL